MHAITIQWQGGGDGDVSIHSLLGKNKMFMATSGYFSPHHLPPQKWYEIEVDAPQIEYL